MSAAADLPWVAAWRDWVAQLGKPADVTRAAAAGGLASAYLEFARGVQRMLADAAPGEFATKLAEALRGGTADSALNDFFQAAPAALLRSHFGAQAEQVADQWSATLRRWQEEMLGLPIIGPQREWQAALQAVQRAALAEDAARALVSAHYRQAWRAALQALATSLERDDGEPITSLRALYDLWVDHAEAAYAERVMTELFSRDFGAWIDAVSDLRLAWKALLLRVTSAVDAPQREEIDALLARQRALERELSALKAERARAVAVEVAPAPPLASTPMAVTNGGPVVKRAKRVRVAAKATSDTKKSRPVRDRPASPAPSASRKPREPRKEFDIAEILGRE